MAKKTAKKVKVDQLDQTHGALAPTHKPVRVPGIHNPYQTDSREEYLKLINKLSDAELHDHAHGVGIVPISHRPRLLDRLEKEFCMKQSRQVFQPVVVQMSDAALERQRKLRDGY